MSSIVQDTLLSVMSFLFRCLSTPGNAQGSLPVLCFGGHSWPGLEDLTCSQRLHSVFVFFWLLGAASDTPGNSWGSLESPCGVQGSDLGWLHAKQSPCPSTISLPPVHGVHRNHLCSRRVSEEPMLPRLGKAERTAEVGTKARGQLERGPVERARKEQQSTRSSEFSQQFFQ